MKKSGLGRIYRKVKWVIPKPIRHEAYSYVEYRRRKGAPHAPQPTPVQAPPAFPVPAWSRRDTPDAHNVPVRIGFVGAGQYARHHLKVLRQLEHVTVEALLARTLTNASPLAAEYGIPQVFTDLDTFLQVPVDCYIIVASAETIKELAAKCLMTGKPVLMEKPPAPTSQETAELARIAQAYGTYGMVCMNRRFYSVIEHGLAALANMGAIRGAMLEVPQSFTADRQSARLSEWDYQHYWVRNSIHGIDLLRYVMGDPLYVYSLSHINAPADYSGASFASILQYDRGTVATITDLWDTSQVWRLKVVAEGGWIEFESLEYGLVSRAQKKSAIRPDPVDVEFRTGVYAQDLHFIRAVRERRKPALPACLLPDSFKTMALLEIIHEGNLTPPSGKNLREEWFAVQRSLNATLSRA